MKLGIEYGFVFREVDSDSHWRDLPCCIERLYAAGQPQL